MVLPANVHYVSTKHPGFNTPVEHTVAYRRDLGKALTLIRRQPGWPHRERQAGDHKPAQGSICRIESQLLLGADKEPEVLQALQDSLADKDWSVRAAAVHAIALRNDPALENDLAPLLEDKKEAVRVRAAAGYLRLEGIKSGQ